MHLLFQKFGDPNLTQPPRVWAGVVHNVRLTIQLADRIRLLRAAFLIFTMAIWLDAASLAQTTTATLIGTITDANSAGVPSARIVATENTTGVKYQTQASETGAYVLPALQPGVYSVSASATGFSQATTVITLELQQTQRLDMTLKVGAGTETVTVSGAVQQIQTETHDVISVLPSKEVVDLPSNGRDVFQTLTSTANFVRDPNNSTNSASFFGDTNQSANIGGIGYVFNTFLQDGVNNVSLLVKTANMQPSVEAVSEVSVIQHGADVRFDEPATVNIITKSGTNAIHGTAYDYIRNDAFNAIGELNVPKPPLRQNQFGANVGGAFVKNRLFYFLDWSALQKYASTTLTALVPTAAEAAGDFSADSFTIYDPATYNPSTGTIQAFPGNKIPSGRITNFGALAVAYYPQPTPSSTPGTNFQTTSKGSTTYNTYMARLDAKLGNSDSAYSAWENTNPVTIKPAGIGNPLFFHVYPQKDTNVYVQETHTFSPRLLNIGRFGYNRSNNQESLGAAGKQNYTAEFGIQNLNPAPVQWCPPTITATVHSSYGTPYAPQGAIQNLLEFVDEADWSFGKHYLFFGVEVDHIRFQGFWNIWNAGQFTFNGQFTSNHSASLKGGSDIADLLLGYPEIAEGANGSTVADLREFDVMPYIQDNWHVTPKLNLNLCLRYDFYESPSDKDNNLNIYDLATNTNHHHAFDENVLNFAPRVGFAYALSGHSSVHGGYGYYYAPYQYNEMQWMIANPPNYVLQTYVYPVKNPTPATQVFAANPTQSSQAPFTTLLKMKTQRDEQWDVTYERALGSSWVASIAYLGSKFTHADINLNANQANQALTPGQPQVRPYPWIGDVYQASDVGWANYRALVAQINRRFQRGLAFNVNYVLSRSKDPGDWSTTPEHGTDIALDYGLSGFNIRNMFKFSGVYELPLGPGKQFLNSDNWANREILGGWQVSTIFSSLSGYPFSTTATDNSNTGTEHAQRADEICNPNSGFQQSKHEWFNRACFAQPAIGHLGSEPRNDLTAPSQTNTDISLFKNFQIQEGRFVQFRSDFFNAFNHVTYGSPYPNASVTSPAFGQITSYGPARAIQIALKVVF